MKFKVKIPRVMRGIHQHHHCNNNSLILFNSFTFYEIIVCMLLFTMTENKLPLCGNSTHSSFINLKYSHYVYFYFYLLSAMVFYSQSKMIIK